MPLPGPFLHQAAGRALAGAQVENAAAHGVVGQRERGGHQRAGVHHAAAAEHHAARVAEEHTAIGLQVAEDERRVGADHAVEQDRRARGLLDRHPLADADAEALPVDAGAGTALHDGHLAALGLDLGLAKHGAPAFWQGQARSGREQERDGRGHGAAAHARASQAAALEVAAARRGDAAKSEVQVRHRGAPGRQVEEQAVAVGSRAISAAAGAAP